MHVFQRSISFLCLIFLIGFGSLAHGQSGDERERIRQLLEERDHQIKELMGPRGADYTEQQREELKDIINNIVDYEAMARFALDEHYEELSEEEQERFVDLFSQVVRNQSMEQLNIYRAEVSYEQITLEDDNTRAMVKTIARLENRRIPVDYRMAVKDGEWRITDISVDNVWTAESYQRSFQNILRRRGYEALVQSLQNRIDR